MKELSKKVHFNAFLKSILKSGWLNPNAEYKNNNKSYRILNQMIYLHENGNPCNNIIVFLEAGAYLHALCNPYFANGEYDYQQPLLNEAVLTHCDYRLTKLLLQYGADANRQFSRLPITIRATGKFLP